MLNMRKANTRGLPIVTELAHSGGQGNKPQRLKPLLSPNRDLLCRLLTLSLLTYYSIKSKPVVLAVWPGGASRVQDDTAKNHFQGQEH